MTPDTSAYMIAGFAVILGGIFFYAISIILRSSQARHQADNLTSLRENRANEFSDITKAKHED